MVTTIAPGDQNSPGLSFSEHKIPVWEWPIAGFKSIHKTDHFKKSRVFFIFKTQPIETALNPRKSRHNAEYGSSESKTTTPA